MSRQTILVGSQDDVQISIPGLTREDVVWEKDGEPIDLSTGHNQVRDNGSLRVFNARESDEGRYTVSIPRLDLGGLPAKIIDVTVRGKFHQNLAVACFFVHLIRGKWLNDD